MRKIPDAGPPKKCLGITLCSPSLPKSAKVSQSVESIPKYPQVPLSPQKSLKVSQSLSKSPQVSPSPPYNLDDSPSLIQFPAVSQVLQSLQKSPKFLCLLSLIGSPKVSLILPNIYQVTSSLPKPPKISKDLPMSP